MIKIKQSKDKQWYFIVVAQNGKTIVTSETYKTKQGCAKGLSVLKKLLQRKEHIRGFLKAIIKSLPA